jgi:hypothetical protein
LRINQTSNTNTQFADAMIDELGNQARRMFAAILPESILTSLRKTAALSPTAGLVAYPADFLRNLEDPGVLIDAIQARKIESGEKWRIKFLEANNHVKSGAEDKYYWETDDGIHCLPTTATTITYKYIRVPDVLDAVANADMPLDVDDMVIDYVFEKLMGTRRGDKDLAVFLAQNRGYLIRSVVDKTKGKVDQPAPRILVERE